MAKFQSPLLGNNNNVRHKNRMFHVQTEDSGVNHPHIITHLFMDGGRILKSVKKSYAEHVGADGMRVTVQGLMKEQHQAMITALREGQFDAIVEGGRGVAAPALASLSVAPSAHASDPTTDKTALSPAPPPASPLPSLIPRANASEPAAELTLDFDAFENSTPLAGPAEPRFPVLSPAPFGRSLRPTQTSIFSDKLVSDKSLDEVILSYLAEDLDASPRE